MGMITEDASNPAAAEPEIDLGDLCKGLLMGQDALVVASAVVAKPLGALPQALPMEVPEVPEVRVPSPVPDELLSPPQSVSRQSSTAMTAEDSLGRSPTISPTVPPDLPHDISLCTPCWGGALKGDASTCAPGFESGKAHFKNKFCTQCRKGITVPASRVRALTPELKALYTNTLSSGFWKRASPSIGGGDVRIANNTITCDGPWLIVYREEGLPDLPWAPMPDEWLTNGVVRLSVAKGTLVPVAEMSRKQSGGTAGPSSAPKRQRRMEHSHLFPRAAPPSIRRAASMPVAAAAAASLAPHVSAPLAESLLRHSLAPANAPHAGVAASSSYASSASSVDDEHRTEPAADARDPCALAHELSVSLCAPPVPARLVVPSPSTPSTSLSALSLQSPATSPAQLAVRLLAAHQQVASLLEQAIKPLSPLRRQLTPEQATSLLGQLNATRASIEACTAIAKTASPPHTLEEADDEDAGSSDAGE